MSQTEPTLGEVEECELLQGARDTFNQYIPNFDELVPSGEWEEPTFEIPIDFGQGQEETYDIKLIPDGDSGEKVRTFQAVLKAMFGVYFAYRFLQAFWTTVRQW